MYWGQYVSLNTFFVKWAIVYSSYYLSIFVVFCCKLNSISFSLKVFFPYPIIIIIIIGTPVKIKSDLCN